MSRIVAGLVAVALAAICADVWARPVEISTATLDSGLPLIEGWRFHPGDDPAWADPELDDSAWQVVDPRLSVDGLPDGWAGIGWFRLHLRPAADMAGIVVGYELDQEGASEVFLDGRRLAAQGTVGVSAETERAYWFPDFARFLPLEPGGHHVLAVRYSNQAEHQKLGRRGFSLSLHRQEEAHDRRRSLTLRKTKEAMFLAGAGAAFAVLHLMLFLYFPRVRANLHFALFSACVAGIYWTDQRALFGHDPTSVTCWFKGMITFGTLLPIAAVLVALSAFRPHLPRYFFLLVAAAAAVIVWCWLTPGWIDDLTPFFAFSFVPYLETLRILGMAIYRRRRRAWVIGLGFTLFVLTAFSPALGVALEPQRAVSVGLLLLLVSISIYLAMGVARTEHDLEARLVEVERLSLINLEQEREKQQIETERRLLEADNRRQAEELEAARQLQLSMLPPDSPQHRDADIAFGMWTATEVGGDYYDYRLDKEGVLTLAIGDATGHGLDAGLVVVAAKSIFQTPTDGDGLGTLLERLSCGIRGLRLKRMNMAMSLVRLEGRRLRLAAAGMPPALLYRAVTDDVEELLLPGPPLGTFADATYPEIEIALEPGDGLLLMSDGLPELEGADGEVLGYERARDLYLGVGKEKPETVLERLHRSAEEFAGGRQRQDDMTLVALQVR